MIAFGFGLVHGFGFSFALRGSLQFAGSHLLTSLLAFNVGVELGQVLVLLLAIPVLDLPVPARRGRAHGHDHPLGAGGPHRVALDGGEGRPTPAVRLRLAGGGRRVRGPGAPLDHAAAHLRGRGVGAVGAVRTDGAEATP